MTNPSDLERQLSSFYAAEAPGRAPDSVLHGAIDAVERTPQRRLLISRPWRTPTMRAFARLGAAAVAVVAVGLGLVALRVVPGPSAQPTPSPTVMSSTTFISDLNAYSVELPSGWRAVPATEVWPAGEPFVNGDARFMDLFISSGDFGPMYIGSQPLPDDPTVWIRDQQETEGSHVWPPLPTCVVVNAEITIDGAAGLFDTGCKVNGLRAYVRTAERGYVFMVRGDVPEPWFRELLATVELGDGS